MIDSSLGATFAPTADPTTKPPASPVESAVQLISTQLPRFFGSPTPVNPALLAGVGGVHPAVASAVVRSVLQALFGPSGLPGGLAPTTGSGEAGDLSRATFQFGGGASGNPPNPNFSIGTPPGTGAAPQPPPGRLQPQPVPPSGPGAGVGNGAPLSPPPVPAAAGPGSFGAPLQGGRDTLGKF